VALGAGGARLRRALALGVIQAGVAVSLHACAPRGEAPPQRPALLRVPWPDAAASDAIGPAFPSLAADCSRLAYAAGGEVYVHALPEGPSARVSVGPGGAAANRPSGMPVLSGDGTRIAFDSAATNLVPGPQNRHDHVYVRELAGGPLLRASVGSTGELADDANLAYHGGLALSHDGSVVAFNSHAANLVAGDLNRRIDVFVRALPDGPPVRVSASLSGGGNGDSVSPALSGDGRTIVFASDASDLVREDRNGARDVFLHDRATPRTRRLSVAPDGAEANGASDAPAISADGGTVAFASEATNLAPRGSASARSVWVLELASGALTEVTAGLGPEERADLPALSGDGRGSRPSRRSPRTSRPTTVTGAATCSWPRCPRRRRAVGPAEPRGTRPAPASRGGASGRRGP
jgi:hypothetical protein